MRMRLVLGLAALATAALSAGQVDAACQNLRFGSVPQFGWQGDGSGYNPFDANTYKEEGTIEVQKKSGTCSYFITVSEGNASDFNRFFEDDGYRLYYNIYDDVSLSNVLKDLPTATVNEVVVGQFGSGNSQTHTYVVSIPGGQIVPRGGYRDRVTLRLYEGTFGQSNSREDSDRLTLRTFVPEVAEIALVPTGAMFSDSATSYTVNFGVLQEGERERFDLLVRANVGYRVLMSSDNRGVLQLASGAGGTVPYELTIDGRLIDLDTNNVEVASKNGPTALAGERYAIEVDIGTLADAVPGTYRDDITVTVRTN